MKDPDIIVGIFLLTLQGVEGVKRPKQKTTGYAGGLDLKVSLFDALVDRKDLVPI